jgi:hypothetical protein
VILPFGKYRGREIADIPGSYLAWLFEESTNLRPVLRLAIRQELARRFGEPAPPARAMLPPIPSDLRDPVARIVTSGYRAAARQAHPDIGGTHQAMVGLTAAREWLCATLAVRS